MGDALSFCEILHEPDKDLLWKAFYRNGHTTSNNIMLSFKYTLIYTRNDAGRFRKLD